MILNIVNIMIQRLQIKPTIRFLGIQYDGTNHDDIIKFCKQCFYTSEGLKFNKGANLMKVLPTNWIVNTYDDYCIILTDVEVKAIFKTNNSR